MQPTLVIGIGGSGMKVGHALKYLFGSFMPEELLRVENGENKGNIKFLFLDNDLNEKERGKKILGTQEKLFNPNDILWISGITPNSIIEEIKRYHRDEIKKLRDEYVELEKWIDTHENLYYPRSETLRGLEGRRQLGRLYLYFNYGKVLDSVKDTFGKLNEINKVLKETEKKEFNVIIINGISGGTGSSMFLDVSAIVDLALANIGTPKKLAAFINTNLYLNEKEADGYDSTTSEFKNLQMNSWALIQECEYFAKNLSRDQTLLAKYSAKPSLFKTAIAQGHNYAFKPFDNAIIFDHQCNNQAIIPKQKFFSSIANIIFYALTTKGKEELDSHIYANQYNPQESENFTYGALGYKTIKFPSELFTEYFETRYLYEVCVKHLLNKNIEKNKIQTLTETFISDIFENGKNTGILFSKLFDDFYGPLKQTENFNSMKNLFNTEQYYDEKGKIIDVENINQILNQHKLTLSDFSKGLENSFKKLVEDIQREFHLNYNISNKYGDVALQILWESVYNVIIQYGYYGVVGIYEGRKEIKGFLEEIRLKSIELYTILTSRWVNISNQIEKLNKEIDSLRNDIHKAKKKELGELLTVYNQKLEQMFNKNIELYNILLKQKVLYEFAVGSDAIALKDSEFKQRKTDYTLLEKYRNQLSISIGTAASKQNINLIEYFESVNSVQSEYLNELRNRFIEADKDVFTMYIPNRLSEYVEENGWLKDSIIDQKYKNQITVGADELKKLFHTDEVDKTNLVLLTRLGEDSIKLAEQIDDIKETVKDYFNRTYINSKTDIGEFINQNIISAYRNAVSADPKLKRQIKDNFYQVYYPIYLRQKAMLQEVGPYINIPNNAEYETFVIEEFSVDANKLVKNDFIKNDQIVLTKYWKKIRYEDISGSDLMKVAYEERELDLFRPHLHKIWNDYKDGINDPRLQIFDSKDEIEIKWNDSVKMITYLQAFQFCYTFNILFQNSQSLRELVYLVEQGRIKLNNAINEAPIFYDKTNKSFVYFTEYKSLEENGKTKFMLVKSKIGNNKKKLPLSTDNLFFESSLKELMSNSEFLPAFQTFVTTLSENYDNVHSELNANINLIRDSHTLYNDLLEKVIKYNKQNKYSDKDIEIANKYIDALALLFDDLFNISIR